MTGVTSRSTISSSSWRERHRAEMSATIKQTARHLLTSGGPGAVSVRAIAREIGVTPPAIYRYYPSIQALVNELRSDTLCDLDERIERLSDQVPSATRGDAMVKGFREWAVQHPAEFWFVLGPGLPDKSEADYALSKVADRFYREFVRSRADFGPGVGTFLPVWARLVGLLTMEVSGSWLPAAAPAPKALFDAQAAELAALFTVSAE